jgi:hypothetical protein
VGRLDEALEGAPVAEALVHAEQPDGLEAPVDRALHVGDRHDLEAVHPQVAQVGQFGRGGLEVGGELLEHQLVDDQVAQRRRLPPELDLRVPRVVGVAERDRRLAPHAELAREGVDDPVQRASEPRRVQLVAVDIRPRRAPGAGGRRAVGGADVDLAGPVIAVRRVRGVPQGERQGRHALQELVPLVQDLDEQPVPVLRRDPGQEQPEPHAVGRDLMRPECVQREELHGADLRSVNRGVMCREPLVRAPLALPS